MLGKILYWLQGNKLLREPKKIKQDIVMIEVIKKRKQSLSTAIAITNFSIGTPTMWLLLLDAKINLQVKVLFCLIFDHKKK